MANASSLLLVVLMPVAAAATSSSRSATQARPTRERCRLRNRMITRMTTSSSDQKNHCGFDEKLIGPMLGWSMAEIPLGPPVKLPTSLVARSGMISPNPSVTMAR